MLKRILVADDSPSIREYLVLLLSKLTEAEVTGVSDGQEALELVKTGYRPDLAFFDLNMPRMDGVQLLKELARLNFACPIVIISGLSQQVISTIEKISSEYRLNVIGTLGKPLDESCINNVLMRLTEKKKAQQTVNELKTYEVLAALEEGNVEPWFQPQIELAHRRLVGFEVLCRIRHHRRGIMLPNEFMATLERSDLIQVVSHELFQTALAQIEQLPPGYENLTVSLNISARLFDSDQFVDELLALINSSPVRNDRITIEITETTVATKPLTELEGAARISIAGCGLSIDDFGSGKATLERMHSLPFSELKIDQEYLPRENITESQRALLESTINMARRLGMKVVVEGVETFQQWELVQHLGCELAQGYFIAPPMPFDDLPDWIRQWEQKT